MGGSLICANLFSHVVTTFIIDSYKTLNLNSGSQIVALLSQISHQLANMNNSTPPDTAFFAPQSPPLSATHSGFQVVRYVHVFAFRPFSASAQMSSLDSLGYTGALRLDHVQPDKSRQ
ncbi:unnamed protein product [Mycena citricolor]|uniref:DUF6535 domain-containing protein n=1 Tax=Mycena citricolor TaxID=2018698 RepID=A0AAD2GTY6_9AGAR|nr:unnamed protein product [Mycena citricolor]